MSREDEFRRRMANACVDRRTDRLELMRRQQRRTRALYEGLRGNDDFRLRPVLGASTERAIDGHATLDAVEGSAANEQLRRRGDAVLHAIDALGEFSDEVRAEWRARLQAIGLRSAGADDSLGTLETVVRARAAELRAVADRLQGEIAAAEMQRAAGLSAPSPVGTRSLTDFVFGSGYGGIARRIGTLPFLAETARQRWIGTLRQVDRSATAARLGMHGASAGKPLSAAEVATALHAELDATSRCAGLLEAIAHLRSACRRLAWR